MIKKRSAQLTALSCAVCLSLWLLGLPVSAAAKTKEATVNRCVSTAVGVPDGPPPPFNALNPAASFAVPVQVPRFKRRPQSGVVTAFHSVGVRIAHTDDGDLDLFLVSPGGRAVALSTFRDQSTSNNTDSEGRPLPSGDGYGSGAQSCSGSLVQLGDAFPASIASPGNAGPDAPITGSFRPEQPLSTFVGGPARGFWTLIVQDVQAQDVGQINALSLSFTYRYKTKRKRR
jgi:hypothetical protein